MTKEKFALNPAPLIKYPVSTLKFSYSWRKNGEVEKKCCWISFFFLCQKIVSRHSIVRLRNNSWTDVRFYLSIRKSSQFTSRVCTCVDQACILLGSSLQTFNFRKMSQFRKGEPFPVLTTRVNHKSHRIKLNRVWSTHPALYTWKLIIILDNVTIAIIYLNGSYVQVFQQRTAYVCLCSYMCMDITYLPILYLW